MSMVHEPCLQLSQFCPHLPALLCKTLGFCSLFLCVLAMGPASRCKACQPVLRSYANAVAAVEPTSAVLLGSRTPALRASSGTGLASLTLPAWPIKPWFSVTFHYLPNSTVHGVLFKRFLVAVESPNFLSKLNQAFYLKKGLLQLFYPCNNVNTYCFEAFA